MTNISDYRPKSGKVEWHLTYKCNLRCTSCSRCSWMDRPHTEDMTIDDAYNFIRQADDMGWRKMPGPGGVEPPRIILIGGEPTLHPDFLEFVRIATEWSGTYVQVFSNGYTPGTRKLLDLACTRYNASINNEGFKTKARNEINDGSQEWNLETYVSPTEAGLPIKICYCHSFIICGIGMDHNGYSLCPIGLSVAKILNTSGIVKEFSSLWDIETAYEITREICSHCGYAIKYRYDSEDYEKFMEFTRHCNRIRGSVVSPIWEETFKKMGIV